MPEKFDNSDARTSSRSKIYKTIQSANDESLSLMLGGSSSEVRRRKPSEVLKVVFADEEDSKNSSPEEKSTKPTSSRYARNIDTPSTMELSEGDLSNDSHVALRDIQLQAEKHLEPLSEISLSQSRPENVDDINNEIKRESPRSSTRFSSLYRRRSSFHDDMEIVDPAIIDDSILPSGRARFSEYAGIQNTDIESSELDHLSSIEATAFAIVLQEGAEFLGILEHAIPAKVDKRWDESYKTIDERYGTPNDPRLIYREDMGLLPLVPTIAQKNQRDRTYIFNILKDTIRDIKYKGRYDRLEIEVDDILRIFEGERNLEANHENWMGQKKQLQDLINSERTNNEEDIKNGIDSTRKMNAEIDNVRFANESKFNYVQQWEAARLDQQKFGLEMKEGKIGNDLEECTTMKKADEIVSEEVRNFLQSNTQERQNDTVAWAALYNNEIERLQQEINEAKEKIEYAKLDLQNSQELRDERQIFLDKCNKEKELAEQETEYLEAVHSAATVIQTLWRGYMVRHKLGQYKKLWASLTKKKGKKTKKSKSKKTK